MIILLIQLTLLLNQDIGHQCLSLILISWLSSIIIRSMPSESLIYLEPTRTSLDQLWDKLYKTMALTIETSYSRLMSNTLWLIHLTPTPIPNTTLLRKKRIWWSTTWRVDREIQDNSNHSEERPLTSTLPTFCVLLSARTISVAKMRIQSSLIMTQKLVTGGSWEWSLKRKLICISLVKATIS